MAAGGLWGHPEAGHADLPAQLCRRRDPGFPAAVLRPWRALSAAGSHPDRYPSLRRGRGGALSHGDRCAGARSLLAGRLWRADLALHRPRRRHPQPDARHRARGHLGLFRRQDRYLDPAADRDHPVLPLDPALDGAGRGLADQLVHGAGLFRHHRHSLDHRLDGSGPGGARPLPLAARGGFRAGRQAIAARARPGSSASICCPIS